MLIDSHSHLNFKAYKDDLNEVLSRTLKNNVWCINVGTKYETSKQAIEIAEKFQEGVYASIGMHPIHINPVRKTEQSELFDLSKNSFNKNNLDQSPAKISQKEILANGLSNGVKTGLVKFKTDPEEGSFETLGEDFDVNKYRELAKSKKVVAIGEIGLDYYYRPKTAVRLEQFKNQQKELFIKQLELAKELNLPVIIHCRMAHTDVLGILKSQNPKLRGVIHCFTGNLEEANEYIKMGFYIGLNGIIFKLNIDEVIKNIPLDKILLETDCPYLTPPQAGEKDKRNEPIFAKYVAERIAELRGINLDEVEGITVESTRKLFNI